jgi:hypothetical protein
MSKFFCAIVTSALVHSSISSMEVTRVTEKNSLHHSTSDSEDSYFEKLHTCFKKNDHEALTELLKNESDKQSTKRTNLIRPYLNPVARKLMNPNDKSSETVMLQLGAVYSPNSPLTTLIEIAEQDNIRALKIYLAKKAENPQMHPEDVMSTLFSRQSVKCIKYVLNPKYDNLTNINKPDSLAGNITPLECALNEYCAIPEETQLEALDLLLQKENLNLYPVNTYGETPWDRLKDRHFTPELVGLIEKYKINVVRSQTTTEASFTKKDKKKQRCLIQ